MLDLFSERPRFWKDLLNDSNELKEPVHYKSYFESDENLEYLFLEEIKRYIVDPYVRENAEIRLYIDKTQRNAKEYLCSISKPKRKEKINDWATRCFPNKNIGIIYEGLEQWSEKLTKLVASLTSEYHQQTNDESTSFTINIFTGNYGYTPFGAHIDKHDNLKALHFHLGPYNKKMVLWEPEVFNEISRSKELNYYNPAHLIEKGSVFELSPGDIFLLPTDKYYHLGIADQFSTDLTIGIRKNDFPSTLNLAFSSWAQDNYNELLQFDDLSNLKDNLCGIKPLMQIDLLEILRQNKYRNLSNLFFRTKTYKTPSPISCIVGRKLIRCNPYSIISHNISDNELEIYACGYCKNMKSSIVEIKKLIEKINSGNNVEISLAPGDEIGDMLIAWLYDTGIITTI